MKRAALLLSLGIGLIASGSQCGATSLQIIPTSTLVLINKDNGHKAELNRGNTDIDQPTQFECVSANGCLVSIDSAIGILASQSRWRICFKIDGEEIKPKCPAQDEGNPIFQNTGSELGSVQVTTGTHIVQTYVDVRLFGKNAVAPRLREWEVHYTIYGE
jgi:hypothetical protein